MTPKPTYEELEQKISVLEKNAEELKLLTRSLLREKNFSEFMLESLPGIFYVFDDTGTFLRWNKNFELFSGYGPDELSTMGLADFFDQDKKKVKQIIKEVFETGHLSLEAYFIPKDGVRKLYYLTGRRLVIDNALYLVGMGIDITEQKNLDAALLEGEKLQGVLEMAGAVCHEMNQPLMEIMGHSDLIALDLTPEDPLYKKAAKISQQARQLGDITQKLMNITRYETKKYLKNIIVDIEKSSKTSS